MGIYKETVVTTTVCFTTMLGIVKFFPSSLHQKEFLQMSGPEQDLETEIPNFQNQYPTKLNHNIDNMILFWQNQNFLSGYLD